MAGSPLDFDFDFANLIISGKSSGVFQVENDLYSDWKELVAAGNALVGGAPPAFLESNTEVPGGRSGGSIGGNDLGGGKSIAPYFFINNIDGWRFRPAEENGVTELEGNFFPLDPATQFLLPTVGGFTQLVQITVSPQAIVVQPEGSGLTASESAQLNQIHEQVERAIYVDTSIGSPDGDGSQQTPFNTFTAAANLAESIGIRNIVILGDSTFDRALAKYRFFGVGAPIVNLNGQNVNQSTFRNCILQGAQSGTIEADDCTLSNNMTGCDGTYRRCGLNGSLTMSAGGVMLLVDPWSAIPGLGRPDIDLNGGGSKLALRRYSGGMTISGMTTAANEVTLESAGGKFTLDSSNTNGTFSIRGTGEFTNQSAGTLVDDEGFIQASDITFIKGLVGGDAEVSLDDQTVTVYNNDVSPRQVLAVYSISADGRVRTRTS